MPKFMLPPLMLLALLSCQSAYGQSDISAQLRQMGSVRVASETMKRGDAARGAILFHQAQYQCSKCHSVGQQESSLGPNLAVWEKTPERSYLIESILQPSAKLRDGYQTVTVLTDEGLQHTGILVAKTPQQITLRDAAEDGREKKFNTSELDDITVSDKSIMPEGLVDQLAGVAQFYDLAKYVIEISEQGPAHAAKLQPPKSLTELPPLPEYEAKIDHAGMIADLDDDSFDRGEKIYNRVCANCHGTHDRAGSLPTSPRFAESKLKNGSDPYRMYQTLTHGYGLMVAQRWMVPQQKYDVINYIRREYFEEDNPSMFTKVDGSYLSALPKGNERGPEPVQFEKWVAMDYGPSMNQTFEIELNNTGKNIGRDLGRSPRSRDPWANPDEYFAPGQAPNYAYKGIAVRLDQGPGGVSRGSHWVVYDHDTMNMHAAWSGESFIDYCCIQFDGRHAVHNRLTGKIHVENPVGPGWGQPLTGVFHDPRPVGRDGRPYGPLPTSWSQYKGLYHHGQKTILSFRVGNTDILEMPGILPEQPSSIFVRHLNIGPATHKLRIRIAPDANYVTVRGSSQASVQSIDGFRTVVLEQRESPVNLQVLVSEQPIPEDLPETPILDLEQFTSGSQPRWSERIVTQINTTHDDVFAVDELTLPAVNPWNAQVRATGIDFFTDRNRAAVCTWDGDCWIVEGIAQDHGELTWQRIASGMFQPLGLKIVDGQIYITCRDQIVILRDLNGDLETDFYECFNSDHQVTEHFHEFAMGLQRDDDGNLYYAKSGRHAKRAVVPHHGTLLKVSPDGKQTEILATGFRAANGVCLNPDGSFFVTDQEGHWNPKNRINWVTPGGFYGNMYSFTDVVDPADTAMSQPLCWITNRFDRSPAELLWVPKDAWGPFGGTLLNLSYGYGKIFVVPHELVNGQLQGGMCQLPIPDFPSGLVRGRFHPERKDLYVCGMFSWAGSRQAPGCFHRVRYNGKPAHLPLGLKARQQELDITFSHPVQRATASDAANYTIRAWDLRRTPNYGSDHYNERPLDVTGARLSDDGKTVTLTVPQLAPTWGMSINYQLMGENQRPFRGEVHNSIHNIPPGVHQNALRGP